MPTGAIYLTWYIYIQVVRGTTRVDRISVPPLFFPMLMSSSMAPHQLTPSAWPNRANVGKFLLCIPRARQNGSPPPVAASSSSGVSLDSFQRGDVPCIFAHGLRVRWDVRELPNFDSPGQHTSLASNWPLGDI